MTTGRWLNPWHVSLALNASAAITLLHVSPENDGQRVVDAGLWLLGGAFGYAVWRLLFGRAARARRSDLAVAATGLAFVVFVVLAFLAIGTAGVVGVLPDEAVVYFAIHRPRYASSMVLSRMDAPRIAILLGLVSAAVAAVRCLRSLPQLADERPGRVASILPLLLLPPMVLAREAAGLEPHLLMLGAKVLTGRAGSAPVSRFVNDRRSLPPQWHRIIHRPNIIVVQLEGIPRSGFGLARNGRPTAPFLTGALANDPRHFRSLPRHYASSGATEVSLYTMLVGLDPAHDGRALGRAPVVWDWAHAAGYTTVLGVPWSLEWADLRNKLSRVDGSMGVDLIFDTSTREIPFDYEIAIRDDKVVDWFLGELPGLSARQRPFLAVLNLQTTHGRGWAVEVLGRESFACGRDGTDFDVYECGIYEIDHQIARVVRRLQELALLDHTVLLITPDHGFDERLVLGRLENFAESIVQVPMFVHLPEHLLQQRPELVLQEGKVTQHADIVPTILDLADVQRDATNAAELDALTGISLFSPETPEVVRFLSVNAVRGWPRLGFAVLYKGRLKYVVKEHRALYDIVTDPQERVDLIDDPDYADELAAIHWLVRRNPVLRPIDARP